MCVCTYLSVHGGQVPDAADNGPAAHHPEEVVDHPKLTAVPEGILKTRVILYTHTGTDIIITTNHSEPPSKPHTDRRVNRHSCS